MKYLCRFLTWRCTSCGQKLKLKQTTAERLIELNDRAERLAASLERKPQTQSCTKCHKVVFETEPGFVQTYLLIDMVQAPALTKQRLIKIGASGKCAV